MKKDSVFPDDEKDLIQEPGGPVTAAGLVGNVLGNPATDLRNYPPELVTALGQYKTIWDNNERLNTILSVWKAQQEKERPLRGRYANWLVGLLIVQFAFGDLVLILLSVNAIELPQWVASTFFTTTTGQIVSMVFLVLRYLFPRDMSSRILEVIQKL